MSPSHWKFQIDQLNVGLLEYGRLLHDALAQMCHSLEQSDPDFVRRVPQLAKRILLLDRELHEECLHTLAFYRPNGADLQRATLCLLTRSTLHRIWRDCETLAQEIDAAIRSQRRLPAIHPFVRLLRLTQQSIRQSIDAAVLTDTEAAQETLQLHEEVQVVLGMIATQSFEARSRSLPGLSALVRQVTILESMRSIDNTVVGLCRRIVRLTQDATSRP